MAMIKFWRGAAAPQERNADTLYFDKSGKLYLGETLIADVTVLDTNTVNGLISTALASYYTKTEIDAIIATLDAEVKGEGTYVDVTVTEVDGKITAVAVDDSAIDAKLADYQPKGDYKTKQDAVADAGLTGAKVLKNLSQDTNGVISYETRDLTPADIGAEAAGTAAGLIAGLDAEKSSDAVEAGKGIQVTVKEVDGKIDEVTVSGNYDNLYDAKGAAATAESNAKGYADGLISAEVTRSNKYVDDKFADANLAQYTTEQEVKDIVDGVIAAAVEGDAIDNLTELVEYLNTHEGVATQMATDIGTLKTKVQTIEGKPAYGIENADITNWDNEIGAKALAQGVKDTINNNKVTWDKAGTAVQPVDLGDLAKKNVADLNLGQYAKTADLKDLAYKAIAEKSDLATDVQTSLGLANSAVQPDDIGTAAAKDVEFFATAAQGEAGVAAKAVTDTLKSAAFVETTAFDAAGSAAAVQGSTTHTVKDCVDAINTMNNNVEGALGEVKNIVEMLTWIEG